MTRPWWQRIKPVRVVWLTLWYGWPFFIGRRMIWRGGRGPLKRLVRKSARA